MKFDKLVESILNESEMTPQQGHVYSKFRSFDWEYDYTDDNGDIIMQRWDRSADGAQRLAQLIIKPDGEHEIVRAKN